MDGYVQLDEISRDILKEIGNVGTGNAVTSLSRMMEQPIELDLPSLKVVKYYKMHELLEQPEELQTGILIEVTGQLKGIFLFMLSEAFTRTVLNTISGGGPGTAEAVPAGLGGSHPLKNVFRNVTIRL